LGAQLGNKGMMAEINMTPLIDIVLVVLIIMMVNIPIKVEQMGLKLPSEVQVKSKDKPPADQLVIAIYSDLTFALNRRLMTEEVLFYEVTRRLRPMTKKNVFIDAHGDIPYGIVVKMMDVAREAGAAQVALARMKEEGPAAATEVDPGAMPKGVMLGSPRAVGAIG
jgi:biopolymer transport protein TolR